MSGCHLPSLIILAHPHSMSSVPIHVEERILYMLHVTSTNCVHGLWSWSWATCGGEISVLLTNYHRPDTHPCGEVYMLFGHGHTRPIMCGLGHGNRHGPHAPWCYGSIKGRHAEIYGWYAMRSDGYTYGYAHEDIQAYALWTLGLDNGHWVSWAWAWSIIWSLSNVIYNVIICK